MGRVDAAQPMLDTLGRPLRDLRLSVTDRCNFRCRYCMPRETIDEALDFLPRSFILTYEEMARLVHIFSHLGVQKVRITGGEPLLRRDLTHLIQMLKESGVELALTTNGSLLADGAEALAAAGLDRVTVSLDSIDAVEFKQICDTEIKLEAVLEGIEAAIRAGLTPLKVNAVVKKGMNDESIFQLLDHFRNTEVIVRCIEYMDVGTLNNWNMAEVIPASALIAGLNSRFPVEPVQANYQGEVANRWSYHDGGGEVGMIASVTEPFCGDCSRGRISADGIFYTCLFATSGFDLKTPLRAGASDEQLTELIRSVWEGREDRYSELRAEIGPETQRIQMSYIGG